MPKPPTSDPDSADVVLKDVFFEKSGRVLLSDLTFALSEKRIGIVGRNGSGKSTLARLICGLIAPGSGAITVCGSDPFKDRKSAIRNIGILFQNPDHQIIFPTVSEEIAFGLTQLGHSRDDARSETAAFLASFGKAHWGDQPVHTLSQGQRHLVCLMAVLAMSPRVILLDEPFAGLDIPTTRQLNKWLESLNQSLIHITHDPESIRDYDRVLWFEGGRLVMDGAPADVLSAYTSEMNARGERDDLTDLPD